MELIKYPRTCHIEGSRVQVGDEGLKCVAFDAIKDSYVVLEEKVDGANTAISFDSSGKLYLQSRGHFLNGGYGEKQFALFKTWASCYQRDFYEMLGCRYILYGEWLYAKHTVFYDNLSHYFMEFDVFDKEKRIFLSTAQRRKLLAGASFLSSVLVLFEGRLQSLEHLRSFLGNSHFKTEQWKQSLYQQCEAFHQSYDLVSTQTDQTSLMEGIYIKAEDTFQVLTRLKFVRSSFLTTILDSESHWQNRPVLPNKLRKGVNLFTGMEGESQ